jgi:hypothetical protein
VDGLDQVTFLTDAPRELVVRGFRHAFFDAPTLLDHFKPTPLGHFRSMLTWEPTEVIGCPIAAKLVQVSFHRALEDARDWRFEPGQVIALDCEARREGIEAKVFVDTRQVVAVASVPTPLILHTYVHELCRQLRDAGHSVEGAARGTDYHAPPGAPPGWPFGA